MKPETRDFHNFLRSRRSVRRFMPEVIPMDVLERVLETATWAPSAHNRQPWRFAVLTSGDARSHLADEMGSEFRKDLLQDGLAIEEVEASVARSRSRLVDAPVAILLCMDPSEIDQYPDQKRSTAERLMALQSVALAGGTLLQAAHAEGMGGVWICAPLFAPQAAKRALGLPPTWEPQGMLLLGYPAKVPEPRPRKPLSEVAIFY